MPGLPAKYAKMGFKKGWKAYKASKKKSSSKKKSLSKKNSTSKTVSKKVGKRSFLSTNTIFKFIRLGALIAPAVGTAKQYGVVAAFTDFAGYNDITKKFDMGVLKRAWMPFVMATLVTYGVQKLGGIIRRI